MSIQIELPFAVKDGGGSKNAPPAVSTRPRLVESLAAACRERPLDEKVLVAPSRFVGRQVVEALVRSGTPWIHLRVESVRSLAHSIVGPGLADEGLTLLSRAQALALVEQACAETLRPDSYFGELVARPGLHRAIQRTFDELRAAGISPAALPGGAFGDARKAAELKGILASYEAALAGGGFIDRAGVLRRAVDVLRATPRPADALYLVAGTFDLSAAERELIDRVSGGNARVLEADPPDDWPGNASRARLFRALGEENEIREIFRRIQAEAIPFDDVEILATDLTTYGPLLYELAEQYEVPCTFANGIAVTFSRPGQAVLGFLRWLGTDFESAELWEIVGAGLVDLARVSGAETPGSLPAAREIREARIGWGRERSLSCLDASIALRKTELDRARGRLDEPEEDRLARIDRLEKRLERTRVVRKLVARLLALCPESAGGAVELRRVAQSASAFISGFARISGELDAMASSALQGLFGELETLPITRLTVSEAAGRLSDAVRALHVAADRPRPGKVYLADFRSGGFSGRARTFVVGLDARRHPGSGLQDPVLLDDERRGINAAIRPRELPMRGGRPAENALALKSCLARLRGEITVSHPCWDLLEAREQFPAAVLLEIYRLRTANRRADYSEMEKRLEAPTGFLPLPARALDESEWWLARTGDPIFAGGTAADAVRAAYPWLADGFHAETERASERFTVWDGWIRTSLDPRTSDRPTSCSRIQELARCPFSYFLKRVLRIRPPDDARSDPTVWLNAMEKGLLLHDVFRRFHEEAASGSEKPQYARDWKRLEEIALAEVARWRGEFPPRTAAAYEALCDDVLVACRIFLLEEEEHCRSVTPRWFEVGFGPSREQVRPPGSPDPVRIPLGGGGSFLLSGRIDRVDDAGNDAYEVWDYKTGSSWQISDPERGRGGRRIQDALYAQALETLLAREGNPGRVISSGYFYAGRRGEGERWVGKLDVAATRETLRNLFDLLAAGAFPHSPAFKEDCSLCDFQKVCGGAEMAGRRAQEKIDDEARNPVLGPYRKLNPA